MIRSLLPHSRKAQRRLYQGAALAVLLLFAPVTAVRAHGSGYERSAASVPVTPVAIVFGAGVFAGQPTPFLARRLDVALNLYRRGKVAKLLVTGDKSGPGYDEPEVMTAYLTARGVPADRIIQDPAGFDTWESCIRAKKVYGVGAATLVTQDFHLPRALMLCRSVGIDAVGVADTGEAEVSWSEAVHDRGREVAAGWKSLYQAWMQPDPRCGKAEC